MNAKDTLNAIYQKVLHRISGDLQAFVDNFCYIEDKDSIDIVVPFKLWDEQRKVLDSLKTHKLNILLKARQLGFTWLVLAYAAWMLIAKQGCTVVALSRTEEEAKELVRRLAVILSHMPELVRREAWYGLIWDSTVMSVTVGKSAFKAFPSSAQAARSFTANLLILDEWAFQQYARELWQAAYPIINRPNGGQVIGLSTIAHGTLFADIWLADNNGFNKIFVPWYADPRRDEAWYQATKAAIGQAIAWEYPATAEEAFSNPSGRFFPELRGDIHIVDALPPGILARYASIDYGLDALAGLFYAVDAQGYAVVYREVYKSGLIASEAAEAIAANMDGVSCVYAPPDLWNRHSDTGRSTADIFALTGVPLVKTSNNRVQGWQDVKEWLRPVEERDIITGDIKLTARLRFLRGATTNLWRCMANILVSDANPNDAAHEPHELTHLPDSIRAFCAGRPRPALAPVLRDLDETPELDDQVNSFMAYGR